MQKLTFGMLWPIWQRKVNKAWFVSYWAVDHKKCYDVILTMAKNKGRLLSSDLTMDENKSWAKNISGSTSLFIL